MTTPEQVIRVGRGDTRGQLLTTAAIMAQTVGFDALSLQELATRLGIRKASIFHHFRSKDAMAEEVIASIHAACEMWCEHVKPRDPRAKLNAYFELSRGMVRQGTVCPAGSFALAWPTLTDEVRASLKELHRAHVLFLEGVLQEGVAAGTFAPVTAVKDIAWSIPPMLQGTVQVARGAASEVPINRLERIVDAMLGLA